MRTQRDFDDYLIEHAKATVWCSPYEDNQFIFQLSQLTDLNGARAELDCFGRYLTLPNRQSDFHVYMIGANYTLEFGTPLWKESWFRLDNWMNVANFNIKIYNEKGMLIPLHRAYLIMEYDDNLILAIEDDNEINGVKLGKENLFCHIESTRLWSEDKYTPVPQKQHYNVLSLTHSRDTVDDIFNDILNIKTVDLENIKRDMSGFRASTFATSNGKPVFTPYGNSSTSETCVVYNGSIIETFYYPLDGLPTFQSTLDQKHKYLIYLPDSGITNRYDANDIIYRDDIEISLVKIDMDNIYHKQNDTRTRVTANSLSSLFGRAGRYGICMNHEKNDFDLTFTNGCYYHRNEENSVRMVTHRSFSLPTDKVHWLIREQDAAFELNKWMIRISVKKSSLVRKLIPEANMVYLLDRLDYSNKTDVMTSNEATIKQWRASELEKSHYNFLMRCLHPEITADRVRKAYGYHACTIALSATPISPTVIKGERTYFVLPVGTADLATIYEYDADGLLTGVYYHNGGIRYYPVNDTTVFIESFSGHGRKAGTIAVGRKSKTKDPLIETKVYNLSENNGKLQYVNMTQEYDRGDMHIINDEEAVKTSYWVDDFGFVCYNVKPKKLKGNAIEFAIGYSTHDSTTINKTMYVPPFNLTLFMNGKTLMEGIDYHVVYPRVVIFNQEICHEYLSSLGTSQEHHFHVRAVGHAREKDKVPYLSKPLEVGAIVNKRMSYDNDYTSYGNRGIQVIVDNRIINPHLLTANEFGDIAMDRPNGTPFVMSDHYYPTKGIGGRIYDNEPIDVTRDNELELMKQIRAYFSANIATRQLPTMVPIKNPRAIFSPFLDAVYTFAQNNQSKIIQLDSRSKPAVDAIVRPFKYLLEHDPAFVGYDSDFLKLYPTYSSALGKEEIHHRVYRFLENVAKTYLKKPVDLTPYFTVVRTR